MMATAQLVRDISTAPSVATPVMPADVVARLHHTRWADSSFSFTHSTAMRLEASSASPHVVAEVSEQLGLDVSTCRTVTLDFLHRDDDALTPVTAIWCLDQHDGLVAALIEVSLTGESAQLCAVSPEQFRDGTLTGTITVQASGEKVVGRVHLTLSADRVAIGVQIPVEGTPLLTASVIGEFASRSREDRRASGRERRDRFSLRLVR